MNIEGRSEIRKKMYLNYSKISLTGIDQPGTTSPPSRISFSLRTVISVNDLYTVTARLRGSTTTTILVPASSQSKTFSWTSLYVSPGEMTSTARSGGPGKNDLTLPISLSFA